MFKLTDGESTIVADDLKIAADCVSFVHGKVRDKQLKAQLEMANANIAATRALLVEYLRSGHRDAGAI